MADEKEAKEAPKKEAPKAQAQAPPQQPRTQKKDQRPQQEKKATSIIRMGGKDIDGDLNIERALSEIKGIGMNLSHSISFVVETKLGIPRSTTLGSLSETQIGTIEGVIKNPVKYGIPVYMLNRRKNTETGTDIHLIGSDLMFASRQDINRDVGIRSWRGYRHQRGQRVRGQRTRSTGRTGATVGVMKKAAKQQLAASQQEKGKEAPKPAEKK
ncbi:MAG TPA: 30S ribosomal protein S13 [Candidatus Acidoferrum sp.]|nr:30S ribosomal protein S13 [Candidatus Acidoferrum sp.]